LAAVTEKHLHALYALPTPWQVKSVKNLLTGVGKDASGGNALDAMQMVAASADSVLDTDVEDTMAASAVGTMAAEGEMITFWHPSVTVQLVTDLNPMRPSMLPAAMLEDVKFLHEELGFLPATFVNDFWDLREVQIARF